MQIKEAENFVIALANRTNRTSRRHCEVRESFETNHTNRHCSSLRENPQDFRGNPNHANLKGKEK